MRLAIVSLMGGAPWGGSEALWHKLALFALEKNDEVFLSVYKWDSTHPKILELKNKGAKIYFRKRHNANLGFIEKLKRFLKKSIPTLNEDYKSVIDYKPDTVFISQGDEFEFAVSHKSLYKLLQANKIPYSFVCHSHQQYSYIPPKEIYPAAKEVFENARYVFFISERQKKLTQRKLVTQLTNAVHTWNPLNLQTPNEPLQWPDDDIVQMAIVGVLDGAKGHDTALEILSSTIWKKRNWKLNLYGDGIGKKYLEDLALFYGINDKVIFHGFTNNIINVWANNHILLIPSSWEGMPISLIEAMVCGRPIITTDIGGITEIVEENQNGYIAASPTVEKYSEAMENAWKNKNLWKQIGINNFNRVAIEIDRIPEKSVYDKLSNEL
jgi:L-malate glycosyltransferase